MRSSGGDPTILQLWSSSVRTMWPFWVIPIRFKVRSLPGVVEVGFDALVVGCCITGREVEYRVLGY